MVLKVAAIRGVESNGMMCSIAELELGDDHDGIIELAADAPVGTVYADWAGLDDPVIDVSITPNRQDCMGVRGIARESEGAVGVFSDGSLPPKEDPFLVNRDGEWVADPALVRKSDGVLVTVPVLVLRKLRWLLVNLDGSKLPAAVQSTRWPPPHLVLV